MCFVLASLTLLTPLPAQFAAPLRLRLGDCVAMLLLAALLGAAACGVGCKV
jgi:hypothetical protein